MPEEVPELREVVERNAQAVMSGNFVQLMADITPEALARLVQLSPPGGGPSLATLPAILGYEIEPLEADGDAHFYRARFTAETATASFITKWQLVLGAWKVVDFSNVVINDVAVEPPP